MWVLSAFSRWRPLRECVCLYGWCVSMDDGQQAAVESLEDRGVRPLGVSVWFLPDQSTLAAPWYYQCHLSKTWESTSTLTSPWIPKSLIPSERVFRRCVSSVVYGVLYRDMLCWPWSVPLWSPKSTTASLSLPVFPEVCRIGCSWYWMPLIGSYVQLGTVAFRGGCGGCGPHRVTPLGGWHPN